jgi:hypothetical protein
MKELFGKLQAVAGMTAPGVKRWLTTDSKAAGDADMKDVKHPLENGKDVKAPANKKDEKEDGAIASCAETRGVVCVTFGFNYLLCRYLGGAFVDYSERKNLFLFLQELCTLAKSLQVAIRDAFYKTLVEYGVFGVLEEALLVSDPRQQLWLWLAAADIITNMLNHDPQLLRAFLLTRIAATTATKQTLLGRLVNICVSDVCGRRSVGLQHFPSTPASSHPIPFFSPLPSASICSL